MDSDMIHIKYDPIGGLRALVGDTEVELLQQVHVYWDNKQPLAVLTAPCTFDVKDLLTPELVAILKEIEDE